MNKQTIRNKLIDTLREIQLQGGYPEPAINDQTRPLEDLEGFDSQLGVEATSELSRTLGITIPAGENVFKAKDVARALALNEVVDVLIRLAATSSGAAGDGSPQAAVPPTLTGPRR